MKPEAKGGQRTGVHALVDAHFEALLDAPSTGRGRAGDERALWQHLRGCEACRNRYRAHSLLETLDDPHGVRARERIARSVFPQARKRAGGWAWWGAAGLAAASLALLVVRPSLPDGHHVQDGQDGQDQAFRARGQASQPQDPGPSLLVFRIPQDGPPVRAGSTLRAGEALAFSYVNGTGGDDRLMVFGVDATGRVHWFWPAWNRQDEDPTALPIRQATAPIELGESVRHDLIPGTLTIHGLFTSHPYRVREVESAVAAGPPGLAALRGTLWTERLEVLP